MVVDIVFAVAPSWGLVVLAACAHPAAPATAERDLDVEAQPARAVSDANVDVLGAPAVKLTANAPVRAEASAASARIGIIGRDARARVVQIKPPNEGCPKRWLQIAPRGWVCESNVVVATEPPTEAARVPLDDTREPELGRYGTVHGASAWIFDDAADAEANLGHAPEGAMKVRIAGEKIVRGVRYAELGDGSLIEPWALAPISPSSFRGVVLDGALDVAWTRRAAPVRVAPKRAAKVTRTLPMRWQVAVRETTRDGTQVRIGDAAWIARADLRMPIAATELPPGVGQEERWFDVDLDQQILVAYEGLRPVYATLVSTGRAAHRTPPTLARISRKHRTTTMTSTAADDAYSVADVPWTMFYEHTLALHGTYWHDGFGDVRSHGCVNLAPRDARVLYDWAAPDVPPGWTAVYSLGSLVRIR